MNSSISLGVSIAHYRRIMRTRNKEPGSNARGAQLKNKSNGHEWIDGDNERKAVV